MLIPHICSQPEFLMSWHFQRSQNNFFHLTNCFEQVSEPSLLPQNTLHRKYCMMRLYYLITETRAYKEHIHNKSIKKNLGQKWKFQEENTLELSSSITQFWAQVILWQHFVWALAYTLTLANSGLAKEHSSLEQWGITILPH